MNKKSMNKEEINKRFDEIFNHDPDRLYDNLKFFLHQEIERAVADYQTNDEQRHLVSASKVAKAEERKKITEMIEEAKTYMDVLSLLTKEK